jgi:hypothetical protein
MNVLHPAFASHLLYTFLVYHYVCCGVRLSGVEHTGFEFLTAVKILGYDAM